MGGDTPDNAEGVGRSADGKPAGAEGGGNEDKNEEKNQRWRVDWCTTRRGKEEVENTIHKSADRPIDDLGEKLNAFGRKQNAWDGCA